MLTKISKFLGSNYDDEDWHDVAIITSAGLILKYYDWGRSWTRARVDPGPLWSSAAFYIYRRTY